MMAQPVMPAFQQGPMRIQVPQEVQNPDGTFTQLLQILDIYQRDFTSQELPGILNKAIELT